MHSHNKKNNDVNWKAKFQELLGVCQEEIKKTTAIGIKMLNATSSNSRLHECYEELGRMLVKAIDEGELTWESAKVKDLCQEIKQLELTLDQYEKEVEKIKKDQTSSDS